MTPQEYNQRQLDEKRLSGSQLTRLTELWQDKNFLTVDGRCGPNTLASLSGDPTIDPQEDADTDPLIRAWPVFDGPLKYLPRNRKDVYEIFGNPSNGAKVDKAWFKENIRTFRKAMALPGVPPHRYIKLHKLAEPYIREALRRATQVSNYKIHTFGDFNYRLMKAHNRLSYHAFGIAFDINPQDNPAIRYRSSSDKPIPFSDEWHELRPRAMDRAFVEAIKSVGCGWGGEWETFADDMHFQLVLP